jgi:hypothetical protein
VGNRLIIERIKLFSPSKKDVLIYGIISLFFIIGFLFWYFYFRLDESELKSLETKIAENDEINQYITFPSFSRDDTEIGTNQIYPYVLLGSFNNEFETISNSEKQEVFLKIVDIIGSSNLVMCGNKKYCSIRNIRVFGVSTDKTNGYYFDLYTKKITHNYDDEEGKFQTETLNITSESDNNSPINNNSDKLNLEIVEKSGKIDGDYIYVTGAVKNNSNNSYNYIEVNVTYFNDSGSILDTDTTYVNSGDTLLPNERKSFEVITQMIGEKYTKFNVEVLDYD